MDMESDMGMEAMSSDMGMEAMSPGFGRGRPNIIHVIGGWGEGQVPTALYDLWSLALEPTMTFISEEFPLSPEVDMHPDTAYSQQNMVSTGAILYEHSAWIHRWFGKCSNSKDITANGGTGGTSYARACVE